MIKILSIIIFIFLEILFIKTIHRLFDNRKSISLLIKIIAYLSVAYSFSFMIFHAVNGFKMLNSNSYLIFRGVAYVLQFSKIIFLFSYSIEFMINLLRRKKKKISVEKNQEDNQKINRKNFIQSAAMGFYILNSGILLGGIARGPYRFRVISKELQYNNLPAGFEGFKIAQISDLHCGSFTNKESFQKGLELLKSTNPDIILFTGDLVNHKINEAYRFYDELKKLGENFEVFVSRGNHDFGDYYFKVDEPEKKLQEQKLFVEFYENINWKLLKNESIQYKGKYQASIMIAGCDNWSSRKEFMQYGNLEKTLENVQKEDFTVLMSHDPSHWRAQVLKNNKVPELMLSGHTHGMQIGVEWQNIKFSPIQYLYPEWAGLYQNSDNQKLYVNRGFGFISYPGRIGIDPEITLLTLKS
jgi:predicted MPP superfamily phosphohydrolase